MGAGHGHPEAGAAPGDGHVFQVGLVGPAQLAGDVQAQPGAVLGGGEERPEQLRGHALGDARAAVEHVDIGVAAVLEHPQPHPRRLVHQPAVLEGVVDQGGEDLLQVPRVDHGRDRLPRHRRFQAVGLDRQGLPVVVDKAPHEAGQVDVFRVGPLAPRQPEHALDDTVGAQALLVDDLQQAAVGLVDVARLLQQLHRVVDRGQRVADFVGQAGREAAQRRQGQRLGAARNHGGVVQENHGQLAVGQQPGEAGLHLGLVGEQLQWGVVDLPAVAPALQAAAKFGHRPVQLHRQGLVAVAQQQGGGFIGQGDLVVGVHHQHAGAHAADDEFVDLHQVGDLGPALFRQPLAGAGAMADLVGQPAQRQVAGDEHAQLGQRARLVAVGQHAPYVLPDQGQAGQDGHHHPVAQWQQHGRGGDVEQQHHRDAGGHRGQGVGGQGRGQDVDAGPAEHQRPHPALVAAGQQQGQRHGQVGRRHRPTQGGAARLADQLRERAEHQRGHDPGFQHPEQAEEVQLAPGGRLQPVDE